MALLHERIKRPAQEGKEHAMKYWPHDTVGRLIFTVRLLVFANWIGAIVGHGLTNESTALVLVSLVLVASAAATLWRGRQHLTVVTSLSQVRRGSLILVVLGIAYAWIDAQEAGSMRHEQSFFWSTIAATSFISAIVHPQAGAG